MDVRDEASVSAFFDAVGPFHHLVFTAGDWGQMRGPTRDLDIEASKARMEVRFWGAARAAKHAVRQIAADGSISLTGGMLAHRPMPGAPLTTAGNFGFALITQLPNKSIQVDMLDVDTMKADLGFRFTLTP